MSKCDLIAMKTVRDKKKTLGDKTKWVVAGIMLTVTSASAMAEPDVILGRLFDTQWLASQGGTTAI